MKSDDSPIDFGALDEKHIEVLRGVEELKNSKEIARDLGISPHTVDQRLKKVQNILGVNSRFEAARIFRENYLSKSNAEEYQSLVYQSPALSEPPDTPQERASLGEQNPASESGEFSAHEAQAPYLAGPEMPAEKKLLPLSVLWENRSRNNLTFSQRAIAIATLVVISVSTFAVLVVAAEYLSRFY